MRTLIVDRKGAEITLDGKRLRIETGQRPPVFAPLSQVERLVLTASTRIQTSVLAGLTAAGASVLILSPRDHRRLAIITGALGRDAPVRLAQYKASGNTDFSLRVAQRLAVMKITGQRRLLLSLRHKPAASVMLRQALGILSRQISRIHDAGSIASLTGMEGSSASAYFSALAEVLPASLHFSGRNRRPPRDPVNAVLSLAYTLLHFDAVRAAHMAGLDPCIGFWHAPEYGRESLACDLVEPFRPYADRFVLSMFGSRLLRPEHFGMQQDACLLGKRGRRIFYQSWETFAHPLRRAMRRGVWKLKRVLEEQEKR